MCAPQLDLEDAPVASAVAEFSSEHPVDINAKSADEVDPIMQSSSASQSQLQSHVVMVPKGSSIAKSAMRFAQAAVKTAEQAAAYASMFARGNGCGTDATAKYIPQGNMLPACNKHDLCYENCRDTKVNCDNRFASDMKAICSSKYSGWKNAIKRGLCYVQAGIYYLAVSKMGAKAYAAGMAKHGCPGKTK